MYTKAQIRNYRTEKIMTGLEVAIIVLLSVFIPLLLAVVYYFSTPFIKKLKYNICTEKLARGKQQKAIERVFEKEMRKNLSVITENPAIIEKFPETLNMAEIYDQEEFAGLKILADGILPVVRALSSYVVPQNEAQANLQKGLNLATEPTIMSLATQLIPMFMNARGTTPASKAQPKKKFKSTIENV